jgi:hypothetical protein
MVLSCYFGFIEKKRFSNNNQKTANSQLEASLQGITNNIHEIIFIN